MSIVTDDRNAVNSDDVSLVEKPDALELWFLHVYLRGTACAVALRFASTAERDAFYTTLVAAMKKGNA